MKKIILIIVLLVSIMTNAQFQWLPLETSIGPNGGGGGTSIGTIYNSRLYFEGINFATTGVELYATDGTQAGTTVVADLVPGPIGGSSPRDLTVFNNEIYFSAQVSNYGRSLFKTNGTTTAKVKNNANNIYQSDPKSLTEVNGQLYFIAQEQNSVGYDIWKTDGTSNGTVKAVELDLVNNETRLIKKLGNNIVYIGKPAGDNIIGNEIYSYNTITNQVTLLLDIAGNGPFGSVNYRNLIEFDNKIFFTYANNLYYTDGQNQAVLLSANYSALRNFIVFNNQLIFFANTPANGVDIFRCITTGTNQYQFNKVFDFFPGNTLPLDPINLPADDFKIVTLNNKLYFAASDEISGINKKIYATDGVTTNVVVTMNFNAEPFGRQLLNLTAMNNKLYFKMFKSPIAPVTGYYYTIWEADPTTGNYQAITEINSSPLENIPLNIDDFPMIAWQNELYFTASSPTKGTELWKLSPGQLSTADYATRQTTVFPNPTQDFLTVALETESNFTIEVYDLVGKKVTQVNNHKKVDMSGLYSGIYFLKITVADSNKSTIHKVIKK